MTIDAADEKELSRARSLEMASLQGPGKRLFKGPGVGGKESDKDLKDSVGRTK